MRVAVVHSFYSGREPSGENVVVVDQVERLASEGYDVRLICRRTDDQSGRLGYAINAAVTTVTGGGPTPDSALAEFEPDVVHLHNTFPNWGTRWLKKWGGRTVVTVHNFRPVCANGLLFRDGHPCSDCLRTPVLPAIRHKCYRGSAIASAPLALASAPGGWLNRIPRMAARVIALNKSAAEVYEETFRRSVDVVPNFVTRTAAQEVPTRRWVYVGRLSEDKGIDVLLRDWPEGEELDVIGDGPLRESLQKQADSRPAVRLLGMLPRSEVISMLPEYVGLVLPSMCAENLPTVILEALAAGTPVVLSRHIQAAAELTREGVAAQFVPGAGREDILRALCEVDLRSDAMRMASRRVHEVKYSDTAWLRSIGPIYREVALSA